MAEAWPTQGELLGLPEPPAVVRAREKRKGGRPPGARNKRTEDVAREVIERMGDPLLHLVAIATAPVDELLAVGLKPGEAMAEKRLAATAALPYLHQRAPVQVDLRGQQVVYLTIDAGAAPPEQNQEVIDVVALHSDGARSDNAAKPLTSLPVQVGEQLMPDQSRPAAAAPRALPFWLPPEPAAAPAIAPAAPAPAPARPPGGGGFAPAALSRAPGGVVFRRGRVFGPAPNLAPPQPGAGGGGTR